MVNTLTKFSISQQSSTFEGKKNISSSIIDSNSLTKEVMQNLFEEFQVQVKHFQHQQNIEIKNLVIERKIKNSDMYKDEHPKKYTKHCILRKIAISSPSMIVQICYAYPTKPSTSNVEQGFSLLTLLLTKQRICLKPKNLEKLMRLTLMRLMPLGMGERRILLNK